MTNVWAAALDDHLDHRFIVLEKQMSTTARFWCVGWDIISGLDEQRVLQTSITLSQSVKTNNHSILRPASKDVTSASALLRDTAVCVLHVLEIGTKNGFRECTTHLQMWTWSLSNLQRNQHLGTTRIYNNFLCCHHNMIDGRCPM